MQKQEPIAAGLRGLVRIGAALAALVAATSCSEAPSHSMPCPLVDVVPGAGYVTRFSGESEDLTDTDFEARIDGVNSRCIYEINKDTGKTTIRNELSIKISASRGPKNASDK